MQTSEEKIKRILTECFPLDDQSAGSARLYLQARGLGTVIKSSALCFHPSLTYFDEQRKKVGDFPSLIGKITDASGTVIGLQRIYLEANGSKANVSSPKKVLGSFKGGGIYFDSIEDVINIVEGPETALAVRQATCRPTVSTVSARGMEGFIIPQTVHTVHIYQDLDRSGTGQKAARELANRLIKEGKEVFIHSPPGEIPEGKKGIDWLDIFNSQNMEAFREAGEKITEHKRQSKIPSLSLNEYVEEGRFPPLIPIVEELLHKQDFVILSATAKTGKSMLAGNLALCVSSGIPFLRKFKTHPVSVLLIQTEVADGQFSERLRTMLSGLELKDIPNNFHVSSQRIKIDTPEGIEELRLKILELDIKLLILDPFYTLHHKDEDKAKDMAPLLSDLREMIRDCGATCLLIHHQGKFGKNQIGNKTGHQHRGSSSFADVPDGSWSLARKSEADRQATLSFELRNVKSPPTQRLAFDNYLWWSTIGDERKLSGEEDANLIADLIQPGEKVTKGELKNRVKKSIGKGDRTADKIIKKAEEFGKVYSIKDGREVLHFRPTPNGHDMSSPVKNDDDACIEKPPSPLPPSPPEGLI